VVNWGGRTERRMEGRDRRSGRDQGAGKGLQDILRAQGTHWSEGVSRSLRALGCQSEEFQVSVFVHAPERMPPDRGSGDLRILIDDTRRPSSKKPEACLGLPDPMGRDQ